MDRFLPLFVMSFFFLPAAGVFSEETPQAVPNKVIAYVGTYAQGDEGGIYRFTFDTTDGTLTPDGKTPKVDGPSFLAINGKKDRLYAVMLAADGKSEQIAAFTINPKTFELTPINSQPSHGSSSCHVVVDAKDQYALVANYSSGSVAVFPLAEDGSLLPASDVVQHTGGSRVDSGRQEGPHPHSVNMDPTNQFVYVPDLGFDRVKIYRLVDGKLSLANPAEAATQPGAGPRHFTFHPTKPWAYVINELNSTVECFHYNPKTGELKNFQAISTLPESFTEKSYCADVHIDPTGRFLYGSNRGHNSIAIFSIDPKNGELTSIGHESTGGDWPRNFAIDPSGKFLLAANRRTSDIHTFRIEKDGTLTPVGKPVQMPEPVCIKFLVP